jgi:hypothetical protein
MAWGDGSIYRRKDGRWCGQLSVGGRRRYVYGRTRREAESKLRRLRELARRGSLPEGPDRTVSHLLGAVPTPGGGQVAAPHPARLPAASGGHRGEAGQGEAPAPGALPSPGPLR